MKKRRSLWLVIALCISLSACSKNKKADAMPVEETMAQEEEAPKATSTEKADGDARETLLALQRVHFGVDKDTLNEDSRAALGDAAVRLKKLSTIHLYVDGHADETGTTEYNLQLAGRRANAVRTYLERAGVEADRLHVVSFGEEKPIATGSGAEALAQNRRVDFRLMKGDIELVLEESAVEK